MVKLVSWGEGAYKTPCGKYMVSLEKGRYWSNNVEGTVAYRTWNLWDCEKKCQVPVRGESFRQVLKELANLLGVAKVTAPRKAK